MVTFEDCRINTNNNLIFRTGEKIILKAGTKISAGNTVKIYYSNDLCECDDQKEKGKETLIGEFSKSDTDFSNEIVLYPNPNNGSFQIRSSLPIKAENIRLFGVLGNELEFDFINTFIRIITPYQGVVLVHIKLQEVTNFRKIIVK